MGTYAPFRALGHSIDNRSSKQAVATSWRAKKQGRAIAVVLLVTAVLLGGASPASAQEAIDKMYCDGPANFCGVLYFPPDPVEIGKGEKVRLAGRAETFTIDGGNANLRVEVNYGRQNGLFFSTNGTSDSGTLFASLVGAVVRWDCTPGHVYKLYSDHWGNGVQGLRLEGVQFVGCRAKAEVGPIEV